MHGWWIFGFWWLIFPIGWFIAGGWHSLLAYKRRKDELDILKTYVSQGKDPPPELTKALSGEHTADPSAHAPYGMYGWRARRWMMFGPWWGVYRGIVMGAIAGGLWYWANYINDDPHIERGVMIAVIVLAVISISAFLMSLMQIAFKPR